MSLEILLGSTGKKTFFAVFDRAMERKHAFQSGHETVRESLEKFGPRSDVTESNPNSKILVRHRDGSERTIASSVELIEKNREILEAPNLSLLCQCLLALNFGPNFQVIEDVKLYGDLFERNREKMAILYDIESLARPKISDEKLIFFAQDLSRSIPVKIIVENFRSSEMRCTVLLLPEKIGD